MLSASPIDDTVTSIVSPSRTNGGNVAVTITAATLSVSRSSALIDIPKFRSIDTVDWII